jgi:hypothetical protein
MGFFDDLQPTADQVNINPAGSEGQTGGMKNGAGLAIASMMGQVGQAIGGNTTGGRIAGVASAIGAQQIQATMAQHAAKNQMSMLKDLISNGGDLSKLTPEQAKALGMGSPAMDGSTPLGASGQTGLESGNLSSFTPAKLGSLTAGGGVDWKGIMPSGGIMPSNFGG